MSDSTSAPDPETAPVTTSPVHPEAAPATVVEDDHRRRPSRLNVIAAWVGIVAGTVFVVAVIFGTGFMLGVHSGGHHHGGGGGGHRDGGGEMHHDGPMFRHGGDRDFGPGGPGGPGGFGPGGGGGQGPGGQGPGGQGPGGQGGQGGPGQLPGQPAQPTR